MIRILIALALAAVLLSSCDDGGGADPYQPVTPPPMTISPQEQAIIDGINRQNAAIDAANREQEARNRAWSESQ